MDLSHLMRHAFFTGKMCVLWDLTLIIQCHLLRDLSCIVFLTWLLVSEMRLCKGWEEGAPDSRLCSAVVSSGALGVVGACVDELL